MKAHERLVPVVVGWAFAAALSGCGIAARSDKFGADVEFRVGGILSYIVDLHFKANIGFSKTCKEAADAENPEVDADPVGLRHFL